jgi:hypothetical protein
MLSADAVPTHCRGAQSCKLHTDRMLLNLPHEGSPCVTIMSVTVLICVVQSVKSGGVVCVRRETRRWTATSTKSKRTNVGDSRDTRLELALALRRESGTWTAPVGVYVCRISTKRSQSTHVRACRPRVHSFNSSSWTCNTGQGFCAHHYSY